MCLFIGITNVSATFAAKRSDKVWTGSWATSPQLVAPNNMPPAPGLAYEIATKTPVLLKNNNVVNTSRKALPLNLATLKKIALLGPQADEVALGPYSGRPAAESMITPAAGIRKYIADKGLNQ